MQISQALQVKLPSALWLLWWPAVILGWCFVLYWSCCNGSHRLPSAEREAKSFVVCWLNIFRAGKQIWSENRFLLLFSHRLLFAYFSPPSPFTHCFLSPSQSPLTLFILLCPGMGWCIQKQSWPYGSGSNLRGAKEKRHRVPNVGPGDLVTYTHTSACRRPHTRQPSWLNVLCSKQYNYFPSNMLLIYLLSPTPSFLVSDCSRGRLHSAQVQQHYSAPTTHRPTSLHRLSSPQHSGLWIH